jgi:hypothetical protein
MMVSNVQNSRYPAAEVTALIRAMEGGNHCGVHLQRCYVKPAEVINVPGTDAPLNDEKFKYAESRNQ